MICCWDWVWFLACSAGWWVRAGTPGHAAGSWQLLPVLRAWETWHPPSLSPLGSFGFFPEMKEEVLTEGEG